MFVDHFQNNKYIKKKKRTGQKLKMFNFVKLIEWQWFMCAQNLHTTDRLKSKQIEVDEMTQQQNLYIQNKLANKS